MEKQKVIPQRYLFIPPAPVGFIGMLAKEHQVSDLTVRRALSLESFSRKAEEIRYSYYTKFIQPYLNKE